MRIIPNDNFIFWEKVKKRKEEKEKMNNNFIEMGNFKINDVIIKDYTNSFNGGLFITIAKEQEPTHFMGVQIHNVNIDILRLQTIKKHITINGTIFKNPKTEKILFVVDDAQKQIEID